MSKRNRGCICTDSFMQQICVASVECEFPQMRSIFLKLTGSKQEVLSSKNMALTYPPINREKKEKKEKQVANEPNVIASRCRQARCCCCCSTSTIVVIVVVVAPQPHQQTTATNNSNKQQQQQ